MTEPQRNPAERERRLDQAEAELWAELKEKLESAEQEQPGKALLANLLRTTNVKAPWLRVVNSEERATSQRSRFALERVSFTRFGLLAALLAVPLTFAVLSKPAAFVPLERASRSEARGAASPNAQIRTELVLSSGQVTVDQQPAQVGRTPLSVGQRIRTTQGRACLSADPDVEVCLNEHSEVQVASLLPQDLRFEILSGSALAKFKALPPGQQFALSAGAVQARAANGVFELAHQPAEASVVVTVLTGSTSVVFEAQQALLVPEHHRLNVALPKAAAATATTPQAISRVEESPLWAQLAFSEWWRPAEVGVVEVVAPSAESARTGTEEHPSWASIDGSPELPLPLQALLPIGKHRLTVRGSDGKPQLSEFEVVLGESRRVPALTVTEAAPAGSAKTSAADLLSRARDLRREGQARAALLTYAELRRTHPSSAEAHTVLVTMGKLELELGESSSALANFQRYLQVGGALGPEALGGKIAALRALGREDAERSAIDEYLVRYPGTFLASKLRARRDSLR